MRARAGARWCALPVLVLACACGWLAPVAAAEFGPIELVSKSRREQAEFAKEPALSANGRYLAFIGELGGRRGVFRKDLFTDTVMLVSEGRGEAGEAKAPSISADGRYVSFTTKTSIEPVEDPDPESEDVYVADLAASPPAIELVSSVEGHRMSGSSITAPQVSMSADGSEVVFVNEGQVYLHRTGVEEPELLSVKENGAEPVPGGGAFQPAGAAISADGNAVAWVGAHLPEQVPLLHDEEEPILRMDGGAHQYHEPLWRRVPTPLDPDPPTRRIVGRGDPLAPGCPVGGSLAEPACRGPLWEFDGEHEEIVAENQGLGWGEGLPRLSADGDYVATVGYPEEFGDLFLVDMESGLTRVEALRQLTQWTNPNPGARTYSEILKFEPYTGNIRDFAISPDGQRVAFTTFREFFPTGPKLVTTPPSVPAFVPELYQLNLELETIERVTPGPGTGISSAPGVGSGAALPTYSADGRLLAFGDGASNLVAGDGNENSDIFLVESTPPGPVEPTTISPPPSRLSVIPAWRLTAHAVSRPNGTVRVIATVPGAGTLRASAKSPVGDRLRSRVVDDAQTSAGAGGVLRLELKLPRKLRKLAHRKGGLYTWLDLRFSGSGGNPLRQQLAARFRAHRVKHPKGGKRG
jgi:hypothetical protein